MPDVEPVWISQTAEHGDHGAGHGHAHHRAATNVGDDQVAAWQNRHAGGGADVWHPQLLVAIDVDSHQVAVDIDANIVAVGVEGEVL
jgi:hypothetical protein